MLQEEEKAWVMAHGSVVPDHEGRKSSPASPHALRSTHRPVRQHSDHSRASFGTSPTDSASSLHGIEEAVLDELRLVQFVSSVLYICYAFSYTVLALIQKRK
jgi:hypothetical protein